MSAPNLFTQLQEAGGATHLIGTPRPDAEFCPHDAEIVALWSELGGVPADLSTVEAACEILLKLWAAHCRLTASLAEDAS